MKRKGELWFIRRKEMENCAVLVENRRIPMVYWLKEKENCDLSVEKRRRTVVYWLIREGELWFIS